MIGRRHEGLFWIGLFSLLILSGCRDSAPTPTEAAQRDAVIASSRALSQITQPSLLVTISDEDAAALVQKALADAQASSKLDLSVRDAKISLANQSITFDAAVQGALPQPKARLSGQLKGVVVVTVDGTDILLTPRFESIVLEEVKPGGFDLMRLPSFVRNFLYGDLMKGVNAGIRTFITQINAQIKPIRTPIDIRPLGTLSRPGEKIKLKIGDRELEIAAPVLAATSLLIEPRGLHVMGQLLRDGELLPEAASGGTEEFVAFRDGFFAKATTAFGEGLAPFDRTGLSVSEAFLKDYLSVLPAANSVDRRREAVRASSSALTAMTAPTFLVTISEPDVQALVAKAINAAKPDEGRPLQVGEPKITLGEQGISFSAEARGKLQSFDATLSGHLDGSVALTVEGTDIVLRPALDSVVLDAVEGVKLTDLPLQSPDALLEDLVALSNVILNSGMEQINSQIEPIRQPIEISPLGTPGHPGETIKFKVGDREQEIAAPVLAATSLLVEPHGLHVMGQLVKEGAELPQAASPATEDFAAFRDDYFAAATAAFGKELAPFDRTQFSVSRSFLKDYLSVLPAVTSEDNRRRSILQNGAALGRIAGPDMVALFPAAFLKEQLAKRIEERRADLNSSAIRIGRVDLSFGNQELRLSAPISGAIDAAGGKVSMKGVVEGAVTLLPLEDGRLQALPSLARLEVSEINLEGQSAMPVDLTGVNVGLNGLLSATLDTVNGLIDTIPITVTNPAIDPIVLSGNRLFSASRELVGQLDAGQMPAALRERFSTKEIVLTTDQVAVQQPGLVWTIADAGATYDVRNEAKALAVYERTPGLTLSRDTITPAPIAWENAAILLSPQGLMLLTDVSVEGLAAREPKKPVEGLENEATDAAFERYSAAFLDLWKGLGVPITDTVTVGLSAHRLADYINQTWASAPDIHADYAFDTGSTPMESTPISLYDKPDLSCKLDPRACARRTCPKDSTCRVDSCTRRTCDLDCGRDPGQCDQDCSTEICGRNPFSGKKVCTPGPQDLTCVLEKAACNTAAELHLDCRARELGCNSDADADYLACQTKEQAGYEACIAKNKACNVDAEADYATCQTASASEKALCDFGREFNDWAGDLGKISGTARAKGSASMTVNQLSVSDDLREASFQSSIAGDFDVNGTLDFVPYDIGNFVVCPWSGTADFASKVHLPEQSPAIRADIAIEKGDEAGSSIELVTKFDEVTVEAKLEPTPAEAVLGQNPQIAIICSPVLTGVLAQGSAIGGLIGLTSDDIGRSWGKAGGFFTGNYNHKLELPERRHEIDPIKVDVQGQEIELAPDLTDTALLFTPRTSH
jgi:hypothetical protein